MKGNEQAPPIPEEQQRLIGALCELPVPEDRMYAVPAMAQMLSFSHVLAKCTEVPRLKRGGSQKAAEQLWDLHEKLIEIYELINEMPREAHDEFDRQRMQLRGEVVQQEEERGSKRWSKHFPHALSFSDDAFVLAEVAARARAAILEKPETKADGNRLNKVAHYTADNAVYAYERVTGTRAPYPTVYGRERTAGNSDSEGNSITVSDAVEFVGKVFDILDIDANPEGYMRAAVNRRRAKRKENEAPE